MMHYYKELEGSNGSGNVKEVGGQKGRISMGGDTGMINNTKGLWNK